MKHTQETLHSIYLFSLQTLHFLFHIIRRSLYSVRLSTGYYSSFVSAIDAFWDCGLMHLYCIIANYFNL